MGGEKKGFRLRLPFGLEPRLSARPLGPQKLNTQIRERTFQATLLEDSGKVARHKILEKKSILFMYI